MASAGAFLPRSTHPRAYGNVAHLLGYYVGDKGVTRSGRGSAPPLPPAHRDSTFTGQYPGRGETMNDEWPPDSW